MIIQRLNSRHHLLGLVATTTVNVGNGYELSVGNFKNLLQQLLPTAADPDHADPHPIISAKHSGAGICKKRSCAQNSSFYEIAARILSHCTYPPILVLADYRAAAFPNCSFIPAQLCSVDASGVPAPRQCVSRLTA